MSVSCSKQTPEEAGKSQGLKKCQCEELDSKSAKILNDAALIKLQKGIQDGTIKKKSDFPEWHFTRTPEADTCWAELRRMREQNELNYLSHADRQTLYNGEDTYESDCQKQNRTQLDQNLKANMESEQKLQQVISTLPN